MFVLTWRDSLTPKVQTFVNVDNLAWAYLNVRWPIYFAFCSWLLMARRSNARLYVRGFLSRLVSSMLLHFVRIHAVLAVTGQVK